MAELVFDGCRVSDAQRLGLEGDGMLVFAAAAESERFYLSAAHVGATKRQLQRSVDYANQRRQFGRPIGEFQAIAHKLARIKVDLELAELMLHKIAWLRGRHQPTYFESAAVKLFTSECYVRASQAALEVHGALGYMRSTGIERQLRDALASTLYAGTSDLQREIVAAWLGLEPGRDRKDHDDVRRQAFREAVD
jgi:alkylation response protein AidB-like acyl-CoA dehydrogenase